MKNPEIFRIERMTTGTSDHQPSSINLGFFGPRFDCQVWLSSLEGILGESTPLLDAVCNFASVG